MLYTITSGERPRNGHTNTKVDLFFTAITSHLLALYFLPVVG